MRRLALALCASLAFVLPGCGGDKAPPKTADEAPKQPAWQDALDTTPELLVVLHPQALRRDTVYGPVIRQLSQQAAARSAAVAAMRALEAFEASDEVIVASFGSGSALVVLRGVRADLDAARLVDASGHELWRPVKSPPSVPELARDERNETGPSASLFVLPERTWVIAVGDARSRAREAFAHPVGRPTWAYDRDALASVRILGPALIEHVPKLRTSGQLSVVGKNLLHATFALAAGSEGALTIALAYSEEDGAAESEVTLRHVLDVLSHADTPRFRWMLGSTIERKDPRVVTILTKLPRGLLDDFAHARGVGEVDVPSP